MQSHDMSIIHNKALIPAYQGIGHDPFQRAKFRTDLSRLDATARHCFLINILVDWRAGSRSPQPAYGQLYSRAKADEADLTEAIIELARMYGRHGYRRIWGMLCLQGWQVILGRAERIWREGLKVPSRQPNGLGSG